MVLKFWFGVLNSDGDVAKDKTQLWFIKRESTDRLIEEKFGALVEAASNESLDHWLGSPRGTLALIILLDQFTRNIYRNQATCFAQDPKALKYCLEGLSQGTDLELRPLERMFFYMPLEHSENLKHQDLSVQLFDKLRSLAPGDTKKHAESFYKYALSHREIIQRFGRFPHRNAILGRENTPEETAFLSQPGSSF